MTEPMNLVAIGAVVAGIIQVLRLTRGISEHARGREQFLALVLGVVFAVITDFSFLEGIIVGLSAMGLYDTTKAVKHTLE